MRMYDMFVVLLLHLQALWTTLVAAIELKTDLADTNDYYTAVGQVCIGFVASFHQSALCQLVRADEPVYGLTVHPYPFYDCDPYKCI